MQARHHDRCKGRISWRQRYESVHGVVGRMTGVCSLGCRCTDIDSGEHGLFVWESSEKGTTLDYFDVCSKCEHELKVLTDADILIKVVDSNHRTHSHN